MSNLFLFCFIFFSKEADKPLRRQVMCKPQQNRSKWKSDQASKGYKCSYEDGMGKNKVLLFCQETNKDT